MKTIALEEQIAPDEGVEYEILEIPDDWDLQKLYKECPRSYPQSDYVSLSTFIKFLIDRGAKEVELETFDIDWLASEKRKIPSAIYDMENDVFIIDE